MTTPALTATRPCARTRRHDAQPGAEAQNGAERRARRGWWGIPAGGADLSLWLDVASLRYVRDMTRSSGFAFTFACAIVAFWFTSQIPRASVTGVDAITTWNVTVITLLAGFAAFITAALIAHVQPAGMSRGRRVAWRAAAFALAIAAAALAPQIAVLAAAGYVAFVLANDVRRRRHARHEELT